MLKPALQCSTVWTAAAKSCMQQQMHVQSDHICRVHTLDSTHTLAAAEISILELMGIDTLLHNGSLRHLVCHHWTVPIPPLFFCHHAQLLLAVGLFSHQLQLLPEYHLLQVEGCRHCDSCSVCLGYGAWVSKTVKLGVHVLWVATASYCGFWCCGMAL